MADIQLRFNRDLLVLSTPVREQLEKLGVDMTETGEMTMLLEPEVYEELYALEAATGAQCLVTDTAALTPARLAHSRMVNVGQTLAHQAIEVVASQNPQHILVELGPCNLPIDSSSKASLMETRDQYVRAVGYFANDNDAFDAYFLNGFRTCTELKCALMGLRKVSDKPIFASVDLADAYGDLLKGDVSADEDSFAAAGPYGLEYGLKSAELLAGYNGCIASGRIVNGRVAETLSDAVAVMAEYGAQVVGFKTTAEPSVMASLAKQARQVAPELPILVQYDVRRIDVDQEVSTPENPYFEADTMVDAADMLAASGVQFMRAVGAAMPSYTGALVAATIGDEVQQPNTTHSGMIENPSDPDALAEMLRSRINSALNN